MKYFADLIMKIKKTCIATLRSGSATKHTKHEQLLTYKSLSIRILSYEKKKTLKPAEQAGCRQRQMARLMDDVQR